MFERAGMKEKIVNVRFSAGVWLASFVKFLDWYFHNETMKLFLFDSYSLTGAPTCIVTLSASDLSFPSCFLQSEPITRNYQAKSPTITKDDL